MPTAETIARSLGGARRIATGWSCRCPAHDDRHPSLSVADAADGRVLVHCHAGCDQHAVIDALKGRGLWPGVNRAGGAAQMQTASSLKNDWHPLIPPPADAPIPDLSDCAAYWAYRNSDGHVLFYVRRYNKADGKKAFLPLVYGRLNGSWGWHGRHPTPPRPLYGLDHLSAMPDADVLVVEGEKAVDAAQALLPNWVVVTWSAGSDAVGSVDWSALAERQVWIWPDRDRKVYPATHARASEEKPPAEQPGMKAAERAAGMIAHANAAAVAIVDPPAPEDCKDGWDLADAADEGWDGERVARWLAEHARPSAAERTVESGDAAEPRSPEFSDDQLALRLTKKHRHALRYVHAWGKWLRWDGYRWSFDRTLAVFDGARTICRIAATQCEKPKERNAIASAKTVAAVERLARSDRRLAATAEQWDTHPWLLPTPGGEVDLRRGELGPAKSEHYMAKITAVAPAGKCPLWEAFLERVTNGDKELELYLQRVVGYCLTGGVQEETLFFLHGTGQNGKGVFIHTVARIFADFHTSAPMEMFLFSKHDRHPTELAGLRGARLVTCTEVEEGRRWDEAKIKTLTGSDTISARFMRQDFFDFIPTFKLMITGNHKLSLSHVDKAISRRFHLIPFIVTIPDEERDDQLTEKLKDEWPGILRWMINGALEWRRIGLAPPEAVREATQEYLSAQDSSSLWIEERCVEGANEVETIAELWKSWRAWCDQTNDYAGKKTGFVEALVTRGYKRTRIGKSGAKGLSGIRLVRPDELEIEPSQGTTQ